MLLAVYGGSLSGKTTLCKALAQEGYLHINFTDILKALLAEALTAARTPTSVEDITTHKEHYRPLLQAFGVVVGFDTDPDYVEEALQPWKRADYYGDVVFDNVRTV